MRIKKPKSESINSNQSILVGFCYNSNGICSSNNECDNETIESGWSYYDEYVDISNCFFSRFSLN